jgi:hypothetical protein
VSPLLVGQHFNKAKSALKLGIIEARMPLVFQNSKYHRIFTRL